MTDFGEVFSVYLLSTIKFVFGSVPLALGFGFSFLKSFIVTFSGGCTGIFIFVSASEFLIQKWNQSIKRNQKNLNKKIFTKKNKLIVQTKKKFGLAGIAFMTPLLLSIPLGSFIAVRYFKNKKTVLLYLTISVFFWSIVSYFLYKPIFNAIHYYFL